MSVVAKPYARGCLGPGMDNPSQRAGGFIVGGLLIGIWLYIALFPLPTAWGLRMQYGLWILWGLVGLAIAGGLLAGRVVTPSARIAIWIALGISVGMLVGAAIFGRMGEAFAALFTAGGGAIIVTSLPGMQWQAVPETPPQEPYTYVPPETTEQAGARRRR